ncbi:MAG: methionyl-tRNA formyltransferase [Deltaproteobacteria bacterium]|nr:methionyl-tRNA formyltransferase [Deltaproteobacteria bacterium]
MRSVFMGTPEFAVPSLRALAEVTTLVGVVSQPDRPRGRGLSLQPSPVSAAAGELGVPLLRPASVRTPESAAALAALEPDLLVVAAYGKILPPALLALPTLAPLNVHASLLPRHRGAAPIAAAIRAGDAETGVTIMVMGEGLDTGDMLRQRTRPIAPEDTTGSLTVALAELGATALVEAVTAIRATGLQPIPQDERRATYAPRLEKDDGRIDWSRDAASIERMVRAFAPWPSAFTTLEGRTLKIVATRLVAEKRPAAPAGTLAVRGRDLEVTTGDGTLAIVTLQPEGKKAMPGAAFAAGARLAPGARLV